MSEAVKAILTVAGFEENEFGEWVYDDDGEAEYSAQVEEGEGLRGGPHLLVYEVVNGELSDPVEFGTFILNL